MASDSIRIKFSKGVAVDIPKVNGRFTLDLSARFKALGNGKYKLAKNTRESTSERGVFDVVRTNDTGKKVVVVEDNSVIIMLYLDSLLP
ncbi:hypothetical protein H4R18_002217 [Coemansia javaensis]|uniref:Uncharacterized protein n=1 Tax=Coemansia javaensis TaxID=2761396 RepID=A0A9W8HF53_9FUNG|nr:hypothetical protein H4R18_002217 [Coemansia javaensis]